MSHVWNAKERDFLRLHYGALAPEPWSMDRIVEHLGLDRRRVMRAAHRFGCKTRRINRIENIDDKIKVLHAQGKSDVQMAGELGVHPGTASEHRKALGLPSNRTRGSHSKEGRDTIRHKIRQYWKDEGYTSVGDYAQERLRIKAEFRYRGCRSDRECDVMEAIVAGYHTSVEIAQRTGIYPTYVKVLLRRLRKRKMIKVTGQKGCGSVGGTPYFIWGTVERKYNGRSDER